MVGYANATANASGYGGPGLAGLAFATGGTALATVTITNEGSVPSKSGRGLVGASYAGATGLAYEATASDAQAKT